MLVTGREAPLASRGSSPGTSEVDDAILARARRGDEAASREFFDHYKNAIFSYLWRMLRPQASQALVEDLVQDTFLRAFDALPRFAPSGAARPSTWLFTIATRLALNEIRSHRRHGVEAHLSLDDVGVPCGLQTDAAAERSALGRRVAEELARLSPEHRSVFLLREVHELSYEEIAQALQLELGTVQSRLARARAALREALEDVR